MLISDDIKRICYPYIEFNIREMHKNFPKLCVKFINDFHGVDFVYREASAALGHFPVFIFFWASRSWKIERRIVALKYKYLALLLIFFVGFSKNVYV